MRSFPILALALSMFGCKSPEERACKRLRSAIPDEIMSDGSLPAPDVSESMQVCLEWLEELRSDLDPTKEEWDTYLSCLGEIESMEGMMTCSQPLFAKSFERAANRDIAGTSGE